MKYEAVYQHKNQVKNSIASSRFILKIFMRFIITQQFTHKQPITLSNITKCF